VDVQLTQDGKLAVFHNDYLSDFTCIDSLTMDQVQARLPFVPELHQVLALLANLIAPPVTHLVESWLWN